MLAKRIIASKLAPTVSFVMISPLFFLPMTNDELQTLRTVVFIDAQAVHGMNAFGQWFVVPEQYCFDYFSLYV